ncbi:helix-turn-helix domain-containing protein [Alicyclobacillus ferrooxydans]|uniref:helix-turn-helix domain-containing protein n=1 Tax=Alicyclobacillus ferrooxydans TaxID=471514 RepID=UPI0006D57FC6|nr:helix-turn-helix transcriptional regulator [Alicyclobacillus ferrooxydans]
MIGDQIRRLRRTHQLSLSELAKRSGVAKSYLSAIERHKQVNPSVQIVERIATVLEVPMHSLLEPDYNPAPPQATK